MEDAIAKPGDAAVSESDLLKELERSTPLLADLAHADVVVYVPGNQPNTAVILAHGQPHTVSSVYSEPIVGRQVGKRNEPTLFQILNGVEPAEGHAVVIHKDSNTQEWFPVYDQTGRVIAALCIESNCLEFERKRKKNHLFRHALTEIQTSAVNGKLAGASEISPLREYPGIIIADARGRIEYVNSVAENYYRKLGYNESIVGYGLSDLMTQEHIFFEAIEKAQCVETEIEEYGMIWIKKVIPFWEDASETGEFRTARPTSGMILIHDVTEERQKEKALRIKSAMIQEIHHRVKNNLQTIAALLRMQARRNTSPELEQMIQESVNRILSIAVVHEFLSQGDGSEINIREVSQRIVNGVMSSILDPQKQISIELEGPDLFLPAQQATSCALIINELLQNAVEHGFPDRTLGHVAVKLTDLRDEVIVEIADDGIGLPESFDVTERRHLGLQIIGTLVKEDLKGRFEMVNDNGVKARVTIPRMAAARRPSKVAEVSNSA